MWTLEKKGLKPDINVSWDDAKPTFTHMALARSILCILSNLIVKALLYNFPFVNN